jgi:hypothetical protein
MNSDEKIRSAFENKNWQEIKVTDSWQIFKIMAELPKLVLVYPSLGLREPLRQTPTIRLR